MVNKVEVNATYESPKQVPVIGQRKRMRVNGQMQTLTLNALSVERRHVYDDNEVSGWAYESAETWVAGW